MPVLINEFEVVSAAGEAQRAPADAPAPDKSATAPLEPPEVLAPLRALQVEYLRVWAH